AHEDREQGVAAEGSEVPGPKLVRAIAVGVTA
ncbi:unnamed protein product, partial [marine sediment metagenome]